MDPVLRNGPKPSQSCASNSRCVLRYKIDDDACLSDALGNAHGITVKITGHYKEPR
jgi:hypothetical protein